MREYPVSAKVGALDEGMVAEVTIKIGGFHMFLGPCFGSPNNRNHSVLQSSLEALKLRKWLGLVEPTNAADGRGTSHLWALVWYISGLIRIPWVALHCRVSGLMYYTGLRKHSSMPSAILVRLVMIASPPEASSSLSYRVNGDLLDQSCCCE